MLDFTTIRTPHSNALTYSPEPPLKPIAKQRHTVEIIQLVEGPPPPPRKYTAILSSSAASSSAYSSDDDAQSSSSSSSEEESACESYCSSDDCDYDTPPARFEAPSAHGPVMAIDQTYASRMKRVFAWRETFSRELGLVPSEPFPPSSLKRKIDDSTGDSDDADETASHSSKRSRASSGSAASKAPHACPACDASFSTRQRLRLHGRAAGAKEACRIAVAYDFE